MQKKAFIFSILFAFIAVTGFTLKVEFFTPKNYTVILSYPYQKVVRQSEKDIQRLIVLLKPYQNKPDYLEQLVALSTRYFLDRPYEGIGAQGEGDWCPGYIIRHGCPHIQQDPIYRTDTLVCNTLVQIILALLHANNIQEFNQNILTINYGAAHEPPSVIHYYNRNNFISADFNPVNQKNGLLQDVTKQGIFSVYAKQTSAVIDRQKWFHRQMQPEAIKSTVRVLFTRDGVDMVERAQRNYPEPQHHFSPEKVTIRYIPKEVFVRKITSAGGHVAYRTNVKLINQLPTPSVIEIVKDVRQWQINGKNIADVIGSGINVSHLGIIYRQYFKSGDIIYQNIRCKMVSKKKVCTVTPVVCRQPGGCSKVMFAHATDAYPRDYYYYRDSSGRYHCDEKALPMGVSSVKCNRVVSVPFGDYLMSYLGEPSVLGVNVEKIMNVDPKRNFN